MPVPKRKQSRQRIRTRQANKGIRPKAFTACQNCKVAIAPHQACKQCGFYKGAKVLVTKAGREATRAEVRATKQAATPEQSSQQES